MKIQEIRKRHASAKKDMQSAKDREALARKEKKIAVDKVWLLARQWKEFHTCTADRIDRCTCE